MAIIDDSVSLKTTGASDTEQAPLSAARFLALHDTPTSNPDAARTPLHPAYFTTQFTCPEAQASWPAEFAIITAYATTGQNWPDAENVAADQQLEAELRRTARWLCRLTGYSPQDGHAEPGWAAELAFATACDVGLHYRQDAIYYVIGDTLYLSFCDQRRDLVPVGTFRCRVHRAHGQRSLGAIGDQRLPWVH
ncbi:MAG: DUF3293 domain-containing protein [Methylococcaceae bacterium]|nr:MAG: DUF3293 domain-containing protein [Methylococcaceae bacterium]